MTASAQTNYITGEITGGSFNADTSTPLPRASYDLSGPGFHFVADGVEPGVIDAAVACATPGCRPGDIVRLSGNFTGSYLGTGMAIVDSTMLTPAYFTGTLTFVADPVTVPRGNRKHLVLTTPFTLTATDGSYPGLTVWADVEGAAAEPWTVATLAGAGTATAMFRRVDYTGMTGFYYVLERVIYSFNVAAATE
jgi:hypothetical protein